MNKIRTATLATGAVALAILAGCASEPYQTTSVNSYPVSSAPAPVYNEAYRGGYGAQQGAYVEYGQVTNIDVIRTQAQRESSPGGAIIGGLVGGVLGNAVGGGSGRAAATALGVVGGAVAGNAIGKRNSTEVAETFRVTVRVENGAQRTYEVPATGDLRSGDRVRIENGVLYRM